VCDSNGLASGSKLSEVARAGGIAAIVGFLPEAAATGDNYPREFLILPSMVPGVFVQPKDRETAIREARTLTNSAQAAATAAISAPIYTYDNTAPRMVGYSGKGPATTMNQLVLKPDITAPGDCTGVGGGGDMTGSYRLSSSCGSHHTSMTDARCPTAILRCWHETCQETCLPRNFPNFAVSARHLTDIVL
jgi:hypothetical protein